MDPSSRIEPVNTMSTLLHTGVHDPAGQELLVNSCGNSAGFPNRIDCAEMIFVSAAREREIEDLIPTKFQTMRAQRRKRQMRFPAKSRSTYLPSISRTKC